MSVSRLLPEKKLVRKRLFRELGNGNPFEQVWGEHATRGNHQSESAVRNTQRRRLIPGRIGDGSPRA